jgi:glutamate formiminotransferase/formiminotetrahydrofolate cyclodeaminase
MLIECVPNFSEGRRPEVIGAIRDAIAATPGVAILDVSSDASHNRAVVTFVAPAERVGDAAFAGVRVARDLIDLNQHSGEHPRIGAADVIPFVPLEGATMDDCVAVARAFGERVGRELEVPVYLYERAATRPERENLADVRRGEFEGLRGELGRNPARDPDFGPRAIHPTFGAVAVGARPFLVAYNVYLGPASNLPVAKEVAKAVRGSSGGLRHVKALGLEVDGQAQVSMNLVDTEKTPLHRAYDMVKVEAAAHGVAPTWSEIVGLVPERVLQDAAARHVQLRNFSPEMVLERKVREALAARAASGNGASTDDGESVTGFLESVAAPTPAPGGGSVTAHVGALAAALARMVAGLTVGRKKYAAVEPRMREIAGKARDLGATLAVLAARDAEAYGAVSAAYKLPKEPAEAAARRKEAITAALLGASRVPLETARACAQVAELAATVAEEGNSNAASDAGVAALLADAACRGAAYNVRINVAALDDRSAGQELVDEARRCTETASRFAATATAAVELAIGGEGKK